MFYFTLFVYKTSQKFTVNQHNSFDLEMSKSNITLFFNFLNFQIFFNSHRNVFLCVLKVDISNIYVNLFSRNLWLFYKKLGSIFVIPAKLPPMSHYFALQKLKINCVKLRKKCVGNLEKTFRRWNKKYWEIKIDIEITTWGNKKRVWWGKLFFHCIETIDWLNQKSNHW